MGLEAIIGVAGKFHVEEHCFALTEMIHNHQRHLAAFSQSFAGREAYCFISGRQVQAHSMQPKRVFISHPGHHSPGPAARPASYAEGIIQLPAAQVASVFIHLGDAAVSNQQAPARTNSRISLASSAPTATDWGITKA